MRNTVVKCATVSSCDRCFSAWAVKDKWREMWGSAVSNNKQSVRHLASICYHQLQADSGGQGCPNFIYIYMYKYIDFVLWISATCITIEQRCTAAKGLLPLIWRATKRSLAGGWYVSISFFFSFYPSHSCSTSSTSSVRHPVRLSPTVNSSPALITLQITGERLLAERRLPDLIVCLRLLFVLHK